MALLLLMLLLLLLAACVLVARAGVWRACGVRVWCACRGVRAAREGGSVCLRAAGCGCGFAGMERAGQRPLQLLYDNLGTAGAVELVHRP